MAFSSLEEVVAYLKKNKTYLYDRFGVTSIGVFGSFVKGEQTAHSDVDMVIEMEKNRKNIHSFLHLKRLIEKEIERKVDIGFEDSLKPAIRDKVKGQIVYV
ncbi:MAG: nucleotidyltransferase domain-containing protein [Candidatus Brocadiaceae bacterium]|nr:nucleotidyltransferase domain-containing protein [Candidatus Brocadiaceae bacterium]